MIQIIGRKKCSTLIVAAFCLSACVDSLNAQGYSGPSLLSRGGNKPGTRGRAPVDFTFYGALRGTYETGLLPASTLQDNQLPNNSLTGVQVELGGFGAHNWRNSSLGVDYRGDYRTTNSTLQGYGGDNHALSAEYTWRPAARWSLSAVEVAGSSSRAFGGFTAPSFSESGRPGIPLNEFFDSRVYFSQSMLSVGYVQTARLAYVVSAGYFAVRRTNLDLVSVNGYRVSGQAEYKLSRSDSISGIYDVSIYKFPRVFGDARIDVFGGQYGRRISRNWNVNAMLGVFRSDTTGTQRVTLSPEVALILGRQTGVEAYTLVGYHPRVELEATYTLQRSRFFAGASQGANPGNGIYLATKQKIVRAGYSYTGTRKLSLGLSAGYSRGSSLSQDIGDYVNTQGGGGINYLLIPHVNFSAQADYRIFSSPGLKGREGVSLSIGLTYSPSSFPLSIW